MSTAKRKLFPQIYSREDIKQIEDSIDDEVDYQDYVESEGDKK